jgi:hypothetical protein
LKSYISRAITNEYQQRNILYEGQPVNKLDQVANAWAEDVLLMSGVTLMVATSATGEKSHCSWLESQSNLNVSNFVLTASPPCIIIIKPMLGLNLDKLSFMALALAATWKCALFTSFR